MIKVKYGRFGLQDKPVITEVKVFGILIYSADV